MSGARHWEQDKESTLYIGNLDEQTTDAQVWELMLQCGPVVNVHLPKDRVSQAHQGYGFVEYATEEDADYASKIMNNIMIYGKRIRVNKASADKRSNADGTGPAMSGGIGAELFIGNLDSMVDERILYDTFVRFGPLVQQPKVTRDENNLSKGYGFVSFASFESSDDAIRNMNGQYFMNKEITVQYAYKKDGKGERHGDEAERALANQARKHGVEVQVAALPPALTMAAQPMAPPMPMANGFMNGGPVRPPSGLQMPYGYAPSPVQHMGYAPPAPRPFSQAPLQAPNAAAGLPARPPPSTAGYGGPAPPGMPPNFGPPGLQNMPVPPHSYMPPGFPPHYPPPPS